MLSSNFHFIAHRGESFDAPENTLASINLAWQRGARVLEVDVHLSKDKQVVVIHDFSTARTGGKRKKVKNQTLAELKQLDVGIFKGEQWKGERIPLLKEVLATVPPNGGLVIEIKCGKEIIPYLKKAIEECSLETNQIVFIAFNFNTICEVKKEFPNHKAYWLMLLDYIWINRWYPYNPKRIAKKVKAKGLDGINVWAGEVATKAFIQRIKQQSLAVFIWVVNNPEKAKRFIDFGANGIATDRASWLKNSAEILQ